jgi:hypothetical protein
MIFSGGLVSCPSDFFNRQFLKSKIKIIMKTQTSLPTRTAESILQEVENGSFENWSIATKALNVNDLELSKQICLSRLSDADTQRCVRVELSSYHQRISKALMLIENEPKIVPYNYTEVRYPVKEESPVLLTDDERPNYPLLVWVVLSLIGLAIYLYKL